MTVVKISGLNGVPPIFPRGRIIVSDEYKADILGPQEFSFNRFNMTGEPGGLKMKKIGAGSDRRVYDIGGGKVLKVAKTMRGLLQNTSEGEPYAPVPEVFERGKDFVVVEKIDIDKKKAKKLTDEIERETAKIEKEQGGRHPNVYLDPGWRNMAMKRAFERIDERRGSDLSSLVNYDFMPGDVTNPSSWGFKNKKPILVDAGALTNPNTSMDDPGTISYSGAKWREIRRAERENLKRRINEDELATNISQVPKMPGAIRPWLSVNRAEPNEKPKILYRGTGHKEMKLVNEKGYTVPFGPGGKEEEERRDRWEEEHGITERTANTPMHRLVTISFWTPHKEIAERYSKIHNPNDPEQNLLIKEVNRDMPMAVSKEESLEMINRNRPFIYKATPKDKEKKPWMYWVYDEFPNPKIQARTYMDYLAEKIKEGRTDVGGPLNPQLNEDTDWVPSRQKEVRPLPTEYVAEPAEEELSFRQTKEPYEYSRPSSLRRHIKKPEREAEEESKEYAGTEEEQNKEIENLYGEG